MMILTSRLLALGVLLLITALPIALGCCIAVVSQSLPLMVGPIILSVMAGVLLSYVLAALTLLISIWHPHQISAAAIAMGIAGGLFFIEEMLIPIMPWLDRVSYYNPFHWYDTGDILIRGIISPWPLLGLLAISLVFIVLSIVTFTFRDAPA